MSDYAMTCPMELSDVELDVVAGGDPLINVSDINVAVPVNAAVAASVLGGPAVATATFTGNPITQTNPH
jgi:hypothetical protein